MNFNREAKDIMCLRMVIESTWYDYRIAVWSIYIPCLGDRVERDDLRLLIQNESHGAPSRELWTTAHVDL